MFGRRWVVVVDDNRQTLHGLDVILRRRGFESQPFSTFANASSAIESMPGPPNAAVIDLCLDHGHFGFELAFKIRRKFDSRIPIAIMTGYAIDTASLIERVREVDGTLLEKPLTPSVYGRFLLDAAISPLRLRHVVRDAVIRLAERHSLVPQECRILGQLAAGSSRADLHHDLGMSSDTVKWQMKGLLAKTGTGDAIELTGLLLREISKSDD